MRAASPAFVPSPFEPALWPIATTADLAAYRMNPAAIPWATDKVAVAEHFARDVLRLMNVHGVAHCVRACSNVDLYVAGQHVGGIALTAEHDSPATAYSVAAAYNADLEPSVELSTLSDPAVVFGLARRAVGLLHVSLHAMSGRVLARATTTTAAAIDWTAVLAPLPRSWGRGVLVMTTETNGKLTRLVAVGVQQQVPAGPVAYARCHGTQLAIVRPPEFHVGYTGDSSFGFYVANIGKRTCSLTGYPSLRFTNGDTVLPFRITRGSSMGYRDPGPRPVAIRPGGAAVFAVDKYRCDTGSRLVSTKVRVGLPGEPAVHLPIEIAYCADGPAGNTLTVTALAATRAQLQR
jgi:hypothetical protein